jgi:hypothetical protein
MGAALRGKCPADFVKSHQENRNQKSRISAKRDSVIADSKAR